MIRLRAGANCEVEWHYRTKSVVDKNKMRKSRKNVILHKKRGLSQSEWEGNSPQWPINIETKQYSDCHSHVLFLGNGETQKQLIMVPINSALL